MHHFCGDHFHGPAIRAGLPRVDRKHTLVLVDRNSRHREEVREALLSFYDIVDFNDTARALAYLRDHQPGAILIADDPPPYGGFETVYQLRGWGRLRNTPIIMILPTGHHEKITAASSCGASDWVIKPYRRSTLINTISSHLNKSIERRWDKLGALQADALKGTVSVFNSLADTIASGEPIPYAEVNAACQPLVEAVNANNFKGILSGVKDHDNYTYVHSLRVGTLLALFGNAINLSPQDQQLLATGGLLHDVGKMDIPHLVLNKPGKLSHDEFRVMMSHVERSVHYLERAEQMPRGVITIAGQHHEKLDGTGYPYNLRGTKLNELARMAAIVDVFSALTDRRVYKPSMKAEEALAVMTDEMAQHLDLPLLALFREVFLDAVGEE